MATKETKDILAGKYGATVKPVDAQLQKKILGENAEIITCRPADLIPNGARYTSQRVRAVDTAG